MNVAGPPFTYYKPSVLCEKTVIQIGCRGELLQDYTQLQPRPRLNILTLDRRRSDAYIREVQDRAFTAAYMCFTF